MHKKICNKCGINKNIEEFYKHRFTKDRYRNQCKECINQNNKRWRDNNVDKVRENRKFRHLKHQKRENIRSKKYNQNNREYLKIKNAEWYIKNKEILSIKRHIYNQMPEVKKRRNLKYRIKYKNDIKYRLDIRMKASIRQAIHNKNGKSWKNLVGYTLNDLIQHLESQFVDGMNWNNYGFGYGKWQIDHIRPKSWFIYKSYDDPEFKQCWALSNLQPLWFGENISKHNRWEG